MWGREGLRNLPQTCRQTFCFVDKLDTWNNITKQVISIVFQRPKQTLVQLNLVAVQLRGRVHRCTEAPPAERWVVSPVRWPVSRVASTIPDVRISQTSSSLNWRRSFTSTSTWRERDASRSPPPCSSMKRRWRSGSRTGEWSRRSEWRKAWYRRTAQTWRLWAVLEATAARRRARPATRSAASVCPPSPMIAAGNHRQRPRIDVIFAIVTNNTTGYDSITTGRVRYQGWRYSARIIYDKVQYRKSLSLIRLSDFEPHREYRVISRT